MFDPNIAMQSMMIHETMRQQQNSMRQLNHMLEQENQRSNHSVKGKRNFTVFTMKTKDKEKELREIFYGDK